MRRLLIGLLALSLPAVSSCQKDKKDDGAQAPGAASNGTPLVSSLKYYNFFPFNHVYTTPVQVGGQSIESVLDTGSSNLLVFGDNTHCSDCKNLYGYNSVYTPGSASQQLSAKWSMNFLPIGQAKVQGYQDSVSYGGQTLNNFAFGMVTSEQGIPNIWGIAYQVTAQPASSPQVPLFDAIAAQANLPNKFSLRLCGTRGASTMTLGGYDSALASVLPQVKWAPLTSTYGYPVAVSRLYIGASSASPDWVWAAPAGTDAIVDSGTNPLVLPATVVTSLVSELSAFAQKNAISIAATFWPAATGQGGYATIADADVAKFPTLYLELTDTAGKAFALPIAPDTYLQKRDNGQRFLGVEGTTGSTYILGTVFMENHVVLFDRGKATTQATTVDASAQVGFYASTSLCK